MMQPKKTLSIMTIAILLGSCAKVPAVNSAKVPPYLIKQNHVYGCNKITDTEKLSRCYNLTRQKLYISNQDSLAIKSLTNKWEEQNEPSFFAWG